MNRRAFLGTLLALPFVRSAPTAALVVAPWEQLLVGFPIQFHARRDTPPPPQQTTITLPDGSTVALGDWIDEPMFEVRGAGPIETFSVGRSRRV